MTDAGAERLALALTLRPDDFPAPGWREVPAGEAAGGPEAASALLVAASFPEDEVRAVAESAAFVRPPASLAFSVAVVLASAAGAGRAFDVVGSAGFASTFADAVAGGVVVGGGRELLGPVASPIALGPGRGARAGHRIVFAGASAGGMAAAYVDVVAVAGRDRLVVLWLGSTPAPFADDERDHLVARVGARLRTP